MKPLSYPHGERARRRLKKRVPPGSSPGTLVADPEAPKPAMSVIAYGPSGVVETKLAGSADLARLRALRAQHPIVWLDVDGLGDADLVLAIGEVFGLHRLALEDVLNVSQRAKVEPYEGVLYVVARMVEWSGRLDTEQLSLFLGSGFVVTFQERPGDGFDPVRARIRSGRGLLRTSGPDYLAYALLDAVIDQYFPVLEAYGEKVEALENEVLLTPHPEDMRKVHDVKRDLLTMRRAVWPLRDALHVLARGEHAQIRPETRLYLNDAYDHTVQVIDHVETYREICSGLMEMYLSSISNRLNEVMKVLTIIATIFIPLNFIAGVYGMNFDPDASPWNMPELRWAYGYPFSLALMAAVALLLLWRFRREGWILRRSRAEEREAEKDPAATRAKDARPSAR